MDTISTDQQALLDYLIQNEADVKAKVESGEYTFATYYVAELAHWAGYGVHSLTDLEKYDLSAYIIDESKSAYGYKMRVNHEDHTLEELQTMADRIEQDSKEAADQRVKWEKDALADFESMIRSNIEMGAADRKTALRWIVESEGCEQDDACYIEYIFGLKYGSMTKEIDEMREVFFNDIEWRV
jgi:hypothetical protein